MKKRVIYILSLMLMLTALPTPFFAAEIYSQSPKAKNEVTQYKTNEINPSTHLEKVNQEHQKEDNQYRLYYFFIIR